MTKFILVLSVCSFLTGECKNPVQPPVVYNDWAECAADAAVKSLELLQKEGKDNVNQYRLAVKFGCYPISETWQYVWNVARVITFLTFTPIPNSLEWIGLFKIL